MSSRLYPILLLGLFVLVWEMLPTSKGLSLALARPSQILASYAEHAGLYCSHTLSTLSVVSLSILTALPLSFAMALTMHYYPVAKLSFQPICIASQSLPTFALAPLLMLAFGWNFSCVLIPCILMLFFPLTITILEGLKATPQNQLDYFGTLGATPRQVLTKLKLPYASPHIFSGLKIACATAAICAAASEWVAGQSGLGVLMQIGRRNLDAPLTYGAILLMMAISLLLSRIIKRVQPLFLLLLAFAGCSAKTEKQTLLLDWHTNPNHIVFYHGVESGIFAKYGIDLEIRSLADPYDNLALLQSGEVDYCLTYLTAVIKAASKGQHFCYAGTLFNEPLNCIITVDEASEAPLGCCYPDGTFHKAILKRMQPEHYVHVGTDPLFSLASKQTSALLGGYKNIEGVQLRSLGISTRITELTNYDCPAYPELLIFATDPAKAERFKLALEEAIASCKKEPEKAFANYKNALHEPIGTWQEDAWHETYPLLSDTQTLDPNIWEEMRIYCSLSGAKA